MKDSTTDRAHELWAAAQLAPGEGIEDGVARIEALLALPAPAGEPEMPDVDDLAQEIRRVDGSHSLGAGALAEALMPFFSAYGDARAEHARRVAIPADAITVNLVRHVGLDKHTARQCEHVVRQILAAPSQGEQT